MLITEVFFSCIVVFMVSAILTNFLRNYFIPLGFNYKDVFALNIYWSQDAGSGHQWNQSLRERYITIKQELENFSEVASVGLSSSNFPYSQRKSRTMLGYGSAQIITDMFAVDDNLRKILNLKLSEGKWFDKTDDAATYQPIIINKKLKEALAGKDGHVIGKLVDFQGKDHKIIGVLSDYRYSGEFSTPDNAVFSRRTVTDTLPGQLTHFLIRMKSGSSIMTEDRIIKKIAGMYPDANIYLDRLEDMRNNYLRPVTFRLILFSVIGLFLLINVALGLFGILWYNINKRRPEIGIRRASGATAKMIYLQISGEVLVLATFSSLLGLFFEIQFTIIKFLNFQTFVYVTGIIVSIIIIYAITIVCAAYPGYLASKIEAATALRGE